LGRKNYRTTCAYNSRVNKIGLIKQRLQCYNRNNTKNSINEKVIV
jgi:hypothetical protein